MFHISKVKHMKSRLNCRMCNLQVNKEIFDYSSEHFRKLPHRRRLKIYLDSEKHLQEIQHYIPEEYLKPKKHGIVDNLCLIDSKIATDIVKRILPDLKKSKGVICETNAGLGFITSELLNSGLEYIRLYETCNLFRETLKGFSDVHPGKVELYVKDLFHMWKMSYLDKQDRGKRVQLFLKGVPKRKWSDDPVLTVVGIMPTVNFLTYLFKMICLQSEIATYGRPELFVIMRPGDFLRLTAGPEQDLHTYQLTSIFANIFCNFKLIEKYPRMAFLPWESTEFVSRAYVYSYRKHDIDKLYLVHIECKKDLPLDPEQLLPFYFFMKQIFKRGSTKIIPHLEKWSEGIGSQILLGDVTGRLNREMDIYVKTGQLTPLELLQVFKILNEQPTYQTSVLTSLVEAELLKYETVQTDIADMHKSFKNPT